MRLTEIRKMETNELAKTVNELRTEIAELRRRVHMGESTNVRQIRNKRKQLSRTLTVLSEQIAKEDM